MASHTQVSYGFAFPPLYLEGVQSLGRGPRVNRREVSVAAEAFGCAYRGSFQTSEPEVIVSVRTMDCIIMIIGISPIDWFRFVMNPKLCPSFMIDSAKWRRREGCSDFIFVNDAGKDPWSLILMELHQRDTR